MTHDKHKIFNIFLLLLPVIDLLTSLMTRYAISGLTIGTVTKSLLLLYFLIYILFITNSTKKKFFRTYILIILGYIVLYFLFKPKIITEGFFMGELSYMMKVVFLPILFSGLICFFDDSGFNCQKMNKIMLINMLLYIVLFLLPIMTQTSFDTYIDGSEGIVGWFYAGNEISAICVMLLPFIYIIQHKNRWLFIIVLAIASFIFSLIGTKVILFGTIMIATLILIETLIESKHKKNYILNFIALLIVIVFMISSTSVKNMDRITATEPPADIAIEEPIGDNKTIDILLKLLSSRDIYIIATNNIYLRNANYSHTLLGLGFSNTSTLNNPSIEKLIEIDLLDLFYHTGLIGLSIVLFPFFYCLAQLLKSIKIGQSKFDKSFLFYGFMILLVCGISCLSGHVLINPAVSIYLCIYLIFFLNSLSFFTKKTLIKNKVEILSLHLGYGGAERATIDLANMLSKNYEVTLISLYKTVETPPYRIDSKVEVNYLTNMRPNREEFKISLKQKRILTSLRQGLKSAHILYLKHKLIKRQVEYTDAEYVISSRIYFTDILNRYGRQDLKTIAIEHNYNIEDKYIEKIIKSTENIDTLVCVSNRASKIYKEKIPTLNIKHIPNIISDDYQKISSLKTKNIIYVGRLEPEKGVLDLIEIVDKLQKSIPDIKLDVYGEGSLEPKMKELTTSLDLPDNIIFHGFKNPKELEAAYSNSCGFILPSHKESFGIVLLEAMKCGIPVFAFKEATGAADLIENKKDGFIIDDRNIDMMVLNIIEYLNLDIKEKRNLQKNAIKKASEFTEDKVLDRWETTLKELD